MTSYLQLLTSRVHIALQIPTERSKLFLEQGRFGRRSTLGLCPGGRARGDRLVSLDDLRDRCRKGVLQRIQLQINPLDDQNYSAEWVDAKNAGSSSDEGLDARTAHIMRFWDLFAV